MLRFGSVFSGIGLLDYGLHLAGIEHAWFCEWDEWRRGILGKRWPGVPVFDDVRTVGDGCPRVDGIAGGFPCKGASSAGPQTGFGHPETVLWREMARAVRELRPRYVLVENVANILALHDGAVWGEVLGDLVPLGYDVVWDCLPAGAVGAPHLRDRVFAIATHSDSARLEGRGRPLGVRSQVAGVAALHPGVAADTDGSGERRHRGVWGEQDGRADAGRGVEVDWNGYGGAVRRWEQWHGPAPKPLVRRMDDRSAARVERSRLSALGDGVQVQVGYLAGRYILELEEGRLAA